MCVCTAVFLATASGSFGVLFSAMGGGASLPALDPSAAAGCLGGSHRPYLFPEASKSDAEEGEGRTKISGVAAGGREYLQPTQEPVPVEREDKSAEDGRAPCHRIADGGREYLVTPLQPHLQIDQDPSNTNAPAPSYELSRPEELVRFLREANVALVRGKFLARLIEENRVLPRRQEAEAEKDAFVTDGELEEWISKQRPVIWTLSHSWESREHADPFGYQICRLKEGFEKTPALGLEMFHSAWFFYDYVCLYQFKRMENHQEDSFRKAMGNMHVLYAHECTRTISIQKAAPPSWIDPEKSIPIYYNHAGKVEPRPIKSLILNDTPYIKRGWTQAELLWSSSRAQMLFIPELNLSISGCTTDAELLDGEASNTAQRAEVPVTPEIFKQRTEELVFTHRVDLDPVIRLQAKVFHYKASSALSLSLQQLTASDVETLSAALPHYVFLHSLAVSHLELNEKAAKSLENALLEVPQLRSISFTDCAKPCPELAVAMAGVLKGRGFLHHLGLTGCCLTTAGMEALAEALKDNSVSLHELVLMDLRESGDGKALAKGVKSNTSVTMLQIYGTSLSLEAIEVLFESQLGSLGFGARYHGAAADGVWRLKDLGTQLTDAVEAVAEGMELTTSLSELDLSYCGLEDPHAQRLAKALKRNQSLRFLDLRSDQPFSEETIRELKDAWNESRPLDHLLL